MQKTDDIYQSSQLIHYQPYCAYLQKDNNFRQNAISFEAKLEKIGFHSYDFIHDGLIIQSEVADLCRSVTGGWAGCAIAHPDLGRIEGATGQRVRAALLLAHPVLGIYLRLCYTLASLQP